MCSPQPRAGLGPAGDPDRDVHAAAQGAERVEDDDDVDGLLEDRSGDDRQQPEAAATIATIDIPIPSDDALDGDRARPPGDLDRLGQAIESVDGDDDVGCLGGGARAPGAHRHADVGEGEGRCVVEPVADHHDRARCGADARPDGLDLLGRHPLGQDRVDADGRSDDVGDRRVVAGDHDDPGEPDPPERADRPRGLGAERVVEDQRAANAPHRRGRRRTSNPRSRPGAGRRAPSAAAGRRRRRTPPSRPRRAGRRPAPPRRRPASRRPRPASTGRGRVRAPVHDRAGEHVRRQLLDRGGQPEDLRRALPIDAVPVGAVDRTDLDRGQPRPAGGERPGLVEQDDAGPRQGLERPAALDDHAAPGRPRDPGDDRDRRGQQERARRRHDQDGQAADGVAGDEPGDRREDPA